MDQQYSKLFHATETWLSSSHVKEMPVVTNLAHHQGSLFKDNVRDILYGGQDTNQKSGILMTSLMSPQN